MGQFKPMVKMETTEPSVILKLAKGGHVNMKKGGKAEGGSKKMAMGGGALNMMSGTPALIGRPAVNAPVRAPGKPSMASRRKAMMAAPMMAAPSAMATPPMKKGGKAGMAEGGMYDETKDKAMIKKAFKQHDSQEHKGGKGTSLKLKSGGMNCATGGVTMGNAGGYKMGGMAKGGKMPMVDGKPAFLKKGMKAGGGTHMMPNGKMMKNSAMKSGGKACATGGVMNGNSGGYATGGVADGQGGYKMGGKAAKKAYATGGTVNSGRPVAMPQGQKPASKPVQINKYSGVYKKGGKVAYQDGGVTDASKGAYDKALRPDDSDIDMAKSIRGFPGKVFDKVKSAAKDLFSTPKSESVTKTKESVTVSPAKKRGGMVNC